MTVWEIIQQFTHMDFTLIVLDVATDYEYYSGPAEDVDTDPAGGFLVAAMEPPLRANEVILYVDVESYEDSAAEIVEDDVLEEL